MLRWHPEDWGGKPARVPVGRDVAMTSETARQIADHVLDVHPELAAVRVSEAARMRLWRERQEKR